MNLDISKAYDRVQWDFLKAIMENMLFQLFFIDLVMDAYNP